MMSGGREVYVGGEGPNCQNNVQYHLFECSFFRTPDLSMMETAPLESSKKLAFNFSTYIIEYWPIPPTSTSRTLTSTHVHSRDECFQAFPVLIFFQSFDSVYYRERNRKIKWGRPGNEAGVLYTSGLCRAAV